MDEDKIPLDLSSNFNLEVITFTCLGGSIQDFFLCILLVFPVVFKDKCYHIAYTRGFFDGSGIKNLPAMQEPQETWFNPWVRKVPEGGHGNPLQYSCLKNPMDRRAWQAIVHRIAKSRT